MKKEQVKLECQKLASGCVVEQEGKHMLMNCELVI